MLTLLCCTPRADKISSLEKNIRVAGDREVQQAEAAEGVFIQRALDAEKTASDLAEKCRLFEKQLEVSEDIHRTDSDAKVEALRDLTQRFQALEAERRRLQDETEVLEQSLSNATKATAAQQWQQQRKDEQFSGLDSDIENGTGASSSVAADLKELEGSDASGEDEKKGRDPHPLIWAIWVSRPVHYHTILHYLIGVSASPSRLLSAPEPRACFPLSELSHREFVPNLF